MQRPTTLRKEFPRSHDVSVPVEAKHYACNVAWPQEPTTLPTAVNTYKLFTYQPV